MKKATLESIRTALKDTFGWFDGGANAEILAELNHEINRGEDAKAKNAEAYESIHSLIMDTLSDTPVTCGELWEAIENDVPSGITKGKVQYALTHLWQDEIVKIEGKPNTYRRA